MKIRNGCSCAVELEGEVRLRGEGELEEMGCHGVVVHVNHEIFRFKLARGVRSLHMSESSYPINIPRQSHVRLRAVPVWRLINTVFTVQLEHFLNDFSDRTSLHILKG